MDDLVPVLVGGSLALVGAVIGIIGTLVNGWIQSSRESRQWVRQQRLEAYLPAVAFLREFEYRASVYFDLSSRVEGSIPIDATADQISETRAQYAVEAKEYHDYLSRLDGELAALVVLGPEPVRQAAEDFARLAREQPTTWFSSGRDFPPLVRAIREALDIPT